uniref:Uncharacterized protein n=1 Tax=Manihot esculenta TaxID=3983 RepID=A0A2C9VT08_MANES
MAETGANDRKLARDVMSSSEQELLINHCTCNCISLQVRLFNLSDIHTCPPILSIFSVYIFRRTVCSELSIKIMDCNSELMGGRS